MYKYEEVAKAHIYITSRAIYIIYLGLGTCGYYHDLVS
jgi:hypothetical protein